MGSRRFAILSALLISFCTIAPAAQPSSKGGIDSIQQEPLKEWLTYIASDELQGRATYSEGLGLAAGYISAHLAQWGVKPAGDNGTYPPGRQGPGRPHDEPRNGDGRGERADAHVQRR